MPILARIQTNQQLSAGSRRCPRRGFALIVTLSLMILLTVLAVGLLTLSTISLRTSGQAEAAAIARANARLSLLLALGELQRQTGSDTRVTARADILGEYHPPVLGVWNSWQGSDHETSGGFAGRPKAPGSNYRTEKQTRFVAWLTSGHGNEPTTLPETTPGTGKVTLFGTGSLGTGREQLQIHLVPTPVAAGRLPGTLAWWIGGENQKARLPLPYQPDPVAAAARWAVLAKSHAIADPQPFRLDSLLKNAAPAAKAITLRQADLIATKGKDGVATSREFGHDLSAVSVGLLTNTATGGWRKDFSLLTEKWASQPMSNLPLFRLTPKLDAMFTRPAPDNPVSAGSMFYPWAAYRPTNYNFPIYQHGPVTSWENLNDFATFYKRITVSSSGKLTLPSSYVSIVGDSYAFLHKVRILPLIARMQWVFSHSAGTTADPDKLEPRLLLTPVITLWNPYNVEITTPGPLAFGIPAPLPAALRYTINGTTNNNYNALTGNSTNNTPALSSATALNYQINGTLTLRPGETRLFSPATATPVAAGTLLELLPGYRSGGGNFFPVKDNAGNTPALPRAATLKADAKFDTACDNHALLRVTNGVTVYVDMSVNGVWVLPYRACYTPEVANVIYKPLTQLAEGTLGQCLTNPTPFLSTLFGARTASRTHLAAKGLVQSSPFVNFTATGFEDLGDIGRHYGGTGHPVNSPFDFSFIKHPAGGDSLLPNAGDASGRGYIVTGFNKADGLSRCVIDELPSRPLVSLGELVNWDLRYENPVPPYAFNLIGNSDATPLLPANAVVNYADAGLKENLQYDDSYCANHLLFDDWFISSITPDPTAFGSAGRSQQATYTDFVTGQTPLANRAYQPILADRATAAIGTAKATKLYTDYVAKTDSWKTIASRLEVEGMFNVNSTSVTAWRALLGHARKQRVPFVRETANGWDTGLSADTDYALTRFSVAGDAKAGEASTSGDFPEANDFAGYRTVDDKFLDALAEEVVRQIRLRGPFLSLAEFVNRQLSSGDLALAGTLQAALNEVTKKPATNPFAALQALSTKSVAVPERAADAEYQFPAAAVGYSGYGLPGWTRQADILRPLAPILSVRDDTFTIRAYGDARDAQGHLLARAVCEAVVRRSRDFLNPAEAADLTTPPTLAANKTFGRRFTIVSFRWLAASEV
ncbi:MAG: pilus assembly PilX N-terminal domain-containing protein [Verrucomicrobia bacterium]|nr:pilus assembly PilX N-terminal domain-containing protein [Verrucomicrobiota bacterium]